MYLYEKRDKKLFYEWRQIKFWRDLICDTNLAIFVYTAHVDFVYELHVRGTIRVVFSANNLQLVYPRLEARLKQTNMCDKQTNMYDKHTNMYDKHTNVW